MTDNDAPREPEDLVGVVLRGKWRLDRLLGEGGMATVFAATHRNGKRGAVKLLHPELARNRGVRARFLREGYVANKVGHPGVVAVLDDDETEDGCVFLVMELLDGETVAASAARQPRGILSAHQAAAIGERVCDVLAAAHAQGIVHRDLKPENLFLTRDGALKVLDFGIARARQEGAAISMATQQGSLLGTPSYMPPEQALGNWADVDGRTDLWAVGATLFSLLTGRAVHEGASVNQVLLSAMTQAAPSIASIEPAVPAALGAVVDRALARSIEERWPDAAAMRDALRAAVPGLGAGGQLPAVAPRAAPPTEDFATARTKLERLAISPSVSTIAEATHVGARKPLLALAGALVAVMIGLALFLAVRRAPEGPTAAAAPAPSTNEAASAASAPLATTSMGVAPSASASDGPTPDAPASVSASASATGARGVPSAAPRPGARPRVPGPPAGPRVRDHDI